MFLLDTNVISELRKTTSAKVDQNFRAWAIRSITDTAFLCAITIMEIEIGILRLERRDSLQARVLRRWFEEDVLQTFATRILVVDMAVARRSAQLIVLTFALTETPSLPQPLSSMV